jgi:glutathione S-transferase
MKALHDEAAGLAAMFDRVEATLDVGPWFAGRDFSLVDAVYGPIFRYFDVLEQIAEFGVLKLTSRRLRRGAKRWLSESSVRDAVGGDYNERLLNVSSGNRKSALSSRLHAL